MVSSNSKAEISTLFFILCNALSISDGLWDTIPSVRSCVQKAFFVCSNFSFCTCRFFIFLVL